MCPWSDLTYRGQLRRMRHLAQRTTPELWAAFLAGYRSVRELPAAAELAIDAYMIVRRLVWVRWLLENADHPGFADWAPAAVAATVEELRSAAP
jgi:Ser/Thr protein kinase RdoA (MazF antagonist)